VAAHKELVHHAWTTLAGFALAVAFGIVLGIIVAGRARSIAASTR
jgi:ABC-type nitrate/sulfonate/bicarbonate transport system permease component